MINFLLVIKMINVNEKNISVFTIHKRHGSAILDKAVSYSGLRICFILHGSAVWQINEGLHTVHPGDIIFLNHNQKRRFAEYGEEGLSVCSITLDRRCFTDTHHFSFFLTCIKEVNGVFKNRDLVQILTEVCAEISENRSNCYEMASVKLTEFFIKAERFFQFNSDFGTKIDKKMLKILDYIDLNITKKITLTEAAQLAGFTESSFSRWFAKLNGISFKKYVMYKKIEYAIFLLETTDLKVIDVAYECGFDSISGFYDTFKKVVGTTPHKLSEII